MDELLFLWLLLFWIISTGILIGDYLLKRCMNRNLEKKLLIIAGKIADIFEELFSKNKHKDEGEKGK